MECLYCKGTLARREVSHTVTRKGYHLILDRVPAWVCDQCGEPLFDEDTVRVIQHMLREVDSGIGQLALSAAA